MLALLAQTVVNTKDVTLVGSDAVTKFTLSAGLVIFITGSVIPILVGVITKLTAPTWLKTWLHLLISVIAGAITAATQLDGTAIFSRATILTMLLTWLVGIATYHGFWKPSEIAPVIKDTTRNFGLTTKNAPDPDAVHRSGPNNELGDQYRYEH